MSQAIFNMIAKKALNDVKEKNINSKDPYFEEVNVYDKHGRATGRMKKQKKGLPVGLSENDATVLKKVRRRAYRLDMSLFNFCGIRFGWSSLVGIIPVIGDFIDMFLAWNVVRTCAQIDGGLPQAIRSKMYFNIILDFAVGLVPFVGDLADAVFRANTRNAWTLEQYLIRKSESERTGQSRPVAQNSAAEGVLAGPEPALKGPARGGWREALFGGGGSSRPVDEEMGVIQPHQPQNPQKPQQSGQRPQESGVMG